MIQVRCQGPSPRCPRSKWCSDMMFLPDLIAFLPHSPNFPEGLSGHKHVDSEIDSFCELHRSKWPYWVSACTEFCSISTLNFESRRNAQLLSTLLSLNHLLFPVRLPFNFVQFLPAPQPVVFFGRGNVSRWDFSPWVYWWPLKASYGNDRFRDFGQVEGGGLADIPRTQQWDLLIE